jgi:hypothetical protein
LLSSPVAWTACHAGSLRYCDARADLDAKQKDRLFRFSAVIKAELEGSGRSVALVARSGLDLSRFGTRYSHAGISLQAGAGTPWAIRQLYYACDERRPRLFDEGLAGFVLGTADPASGFVSVLLLPPREADALAQAALDRREALGLLSARYSANAYAFGERYQNCNQWVAELLAAAWGAPAGAPVSRGEAQQWLQQAGYRPSRFDVGPLLRLLGAFVPWVHDDDHPDDDVAHAVYRVSMPASIEDFVHRQVPDAIRLEFCHDAHRVVVHAGWEPIAASCTPSGEDRVVPLD